MNHAIICLGILQLRTGSRFGKVKWKIGDHSAPRLTTRQGSWSTARLFTIALFIISPTLVFVSSFPLKPSNCRTSSNLAWITSELPTFAELSGATITLPEWPLKRHHLNPLRVDGRSFEA